MKKITFLLIICLTLTNWSFSQCTTQGFFWPDEDVNISPVPGAQTIATNNYADNEYSIITGIVPGETYTVTAAMYITVTESDATTVINHGANSVTFTAGAGVTSIYCFWTIDAACTGGGSTDILTEIECTTCTCTETAIPACTTPIAPVDGELYAATTTSTVDGSREVAFSWNAIPGALSYQITFDGVVLGSTPNAAVNIYGLNYDTTYTWSVTPINCFGTATGCATYTFKTEDALSTDEFTLDNSFSIYPNPAKDVITIKTDLTIESVEIYNQLGQLVINRKGADILENSINVASLNNGIYLMTINTQDKKQTLKFVKE